MVVATLREVRTQAYEDGTPAGVIKGEAAGLIKGEAAGLVKGLQQTLLKLLQYRFQLNEAAQLKLAEQLTKISEVQALSALTDQGLQVASFEEFATHLLKYLPTNRSVR